MRLGDFEILKTLGSGGGAVVFQARNIPLNRIVALKQITFPPGKEGTRLQERFVQEARAMAAVKSDHVVTVYSVQTLDGHPTLEMEYMPGGSLEDVVAQRRPGVDEAVDILQQVLKGLSAIHGAGLIHRDIKPGNILRDEEGRYKIGDFGISILSGSNPTIAAGTAQYVAPEAIVPPYRFDHRADLYSLGMTAYEVLLGEELFQRQFVEVFSGGGVVSDHKWLNWAIDVHSRAKPVHLLVPEIPEPVSRVVEGLMEKDPECRYGSARAALDDLRRLHHPAATDAPVRPPLKETRQFETAARTAAAAPEERHRRRRARGWTGVAVGIVVLALAGIWLRSALNRRAAPVAGPSQPVAPSAPPSTDSSAPPPAEPSVPPDLVRLAEARKAFEYVQKNVDTLEGWARFISKYGDTEFVQAARKRRSELQAAREQAAEKPTRPTRAEVAPSAAASASQPAGPERHSSRTVRQADGMEMVKIPAGSFRMGSENGDPDEQPVHTVRISKSFFLDVSEVTVDQYRRVAGSAPDGQAESGHPVVNVSWNEAQAYCRKVGGRLPTEAEWEYAARGGLAGKQYPWGDDLVCGARGCRANGLGDEDGYSRTAPVRSFAPNGYGLHDMAGNVWEWVWDWYGAYGVADASDPEGPGSGNMRVLRGGSWLNSPTYLRVAYRNRGVPDYRYDSIGFRCARDF